jgi:hypothetical protein
MTSILTIYILIGLTLAFAIVKSDSHKKDSKLEKLLLFLTMTFFWPVGLFFPIRESVADTDEVVIEKLKVGNPLAYIGDVNGQKSPVYDSGSFADGTSKFTVVDV